MRDNYPDKVVYIPTPDDIDHIWFVQVKLYPMERILIVFGYPKLHMRIPSLLLISHPFYYDYVQGYLDLQAATCSSRV